MNAPSIRSSAAMRMPATAPATPASNTTGHCNGGVITGNDATDTSASAPSTFETQWIGHFQSVFGTAASGGVKMYSLDNEVMLWNSTHRDVHPSPTTYDETWNKAIDYAGAIKQKDSNALVTGPVTYGYCDLFGSAADDCLLGDDRTAHGGLPFVAWYLQQVCTYPDAARDSTYRLSRPSLLSGRSELVRSELRERQFHLQQRRRFGDRGPAAAVAE